MTSVPLRHAPPNFGICERGIRFSNLGRLSCLLFFFWKSSCCIRVVIVYAPNRFDKPGVLGYCSGLRICSVDPCQWLASVLFELSYLHTKYMLPSNIWKIQRYLCSVLVADTCWSWYLQSDCIGICNVFDTTYLMDAVVFHMASYLASRAYVVLRGPIWIPN